MRLRCMESLMSTMGDEEIQEAAGMYMFMYMCVFIHEYLCINIYIYVCGVWRV
jgi:hypothetical protein